MSEDVRASFEKLIGQKIAITSPLFGKETQILHEVTLRGVESGGLWIESEEMNQDFLRRSKMQTAPKTLVFFVPYQQIFVVMSSIDRVSLSGSAFGIPE